jgi:DNA helicase-2/ATP-dependent DNA helicase PcrA
LEIELNKRGINYEMRGGLKFLGAHIKDVLAHLKVLFNFKDQSSWTRILPLYDGVGEVTEQKIYSSLSQLDSLAGRSMI